jgi:hypothetical protein
MQTEIAPPQAAAIPTPAVMDAAEEHLANEISTLWQSHSQAQGAVRKTREQLKEIRTTLATRLFELKTVLCRVGRAGGWSSFLESQNIPRSSADRMVRAHEKTLAMADGNCACEQITSPSSETVHRYFQGLWPKLSRVLSTPEAVELFVTALRGAAEKRFKDSALESSGSPAAAASTSGVTL